ncbi:MAG: hypothetical protein JKY15_02490 [Deltaproteobacteria bacterium]|nr:hypothetical protein [Deltaproteobacteria bacterium]
MSLAIFCLLLIGGGLFFYLTGKSKATAIAEELLSKDLPMEQAIREIEVSIWEVAEALLDYGMDPTLKSLNEYKNKLKDVDQFMTQYEALIESDDAKKLVEKFNTGWTRIVAVAESFIKARTRMENLQKKAWDIVHIADDIIDYKIQPAFVKGLPDLLRKEKSIREVEVSIWEANNAVNYFMARQVDRAKKEYEKQLEDVDVFWNKYQKLNISTVEKINAKGFWKEWEKAVKIMNEAIELSEQLKENRILLIREIHAIDDVVDFEIQELLKQRIRRKMETIGLLDPA